MLASYSEWMLGLPPVAMLVVAVTTLMAIALTPMLIWLGYQVMIARSAPAPSGEPAGR